MSDKGDMSELLANVYGNGNGPSDEDKQKIAAAEMFTNLCKEAGINVEELTDEQVQYLWKEAMEGAPKEGESTEDSKEAAAKAEFETKQAAAAEWAEKRAAAEKIAEADALGRIMAHAYVDELKKYAEGNGNLPPQFLKKKEEGNGEEKKDEKKEEKEEEKKEGQANESQEKAAQIIAEMEKKKQAGAQPSSTGNLDEVAANHALAILKEAGVEEELAHRKVSAVYELGLSDSVKIAQAASFEQGVQIRALEFCEAAGFPVNWEQA